MTDTGRTAPHGSTVDALPIRPTVFGRWWVRHPLVVDVLVAVFAIGGDQLVSSATVPWFVTDAPAWLQLCAPLAGLTLLVRRRWPFVPVVTAAAATVIVVSTAATPPLLVSCAAVATIAVERRVRWAWGAAAALVVVAAITTFARTTIAVYALELLVTTLVVLLAAGWIAARRRHLAALIELARRLEVERDREGRLAVVDERARIARDMHDVVGHGLTVMVRLADGAAAVARTDPDRAADAARMVAETGRSSLADLRRTLGVLRDDDRGLLEPQPGLGDLPALVERFRRAGLPVTLSVPVPVRLAEGAELALHRAAQESLTNVLRHAVRPTDVVVDLDAAGPDIVLTVTDDGTDDGTDGDDGSGDRAPVDGPHGRPAPIVGSGRGMVGMHERAAMYGGTVRSGPVFPHGWRTRVTLPRDVRHDDGQADG